jgi:hypothetical protein
MGTTGFDGKLFKRLQADLGQKSLKRSKNYSVNKKVALAFNTLLGNGSFATPAFA